MIAEKRMAGQFFAEVGRQLDKRGLVLKTGTLIDASLIEAQVPRRRRALSLLDFPGLMRMFTGAPGDSARVPSWS